MRRALLLALALVPACDSTKKDCEHARDVFVKMAEDGSKEALATVDPSARAEAEKAANAELEQLRTTFVEHCMALPEEGKKCIAKIDEFVAVDDAREKARAACPKDELDFPEKACRDKADADAEAKLGSCKAELRNLTETIYAKK